MMMMSSRGGGGRLGRGARAYQRSQRKEPEEIKMDLDAPLESNLNEIFRNLVQTGGPAARAYLRPLVKLAPAVVLSHHRGDGKMGAWTLLDIFRCVRVLLVDDETEVKAEALRVLRHMTDSESIFDVLCRALIPALVVKSLDIVLDNKVERVQALRLMRRCASVAPLKFPVEFVHCILAVANDGAHERDNLVKTCVATAAELCIANPRLWLSAGTFMTIVRSVLSSNVSEPRAAESLVVTLMYLINDPKTRHLVNADLVLEYLISPFTDRNFEVHPDDQLAHHEREMKARIALCCVLRSWPGLIYLCSAQSGLTKLIELLRLPDTETQRSVMDLFFDLFCLQTPEWTTDFRIALLAADDKTGLQRGWLLYEGFVAAEGADLIAPISRTVNLSSCYLAILLQAMVLHGLLDAVAEATVSDDEQVSIHATVLLAELLHMCNRLFPHDASHMCHLLPGLIGATMSPDMNIRLKAISVINRLAYIEQFKCETIGVPMSLNLDQQLLFCQQSRNYVRHRRKDDTAGAKSASLASSSAQTDTLKRKKGRRKTNAHSSSLDSLFVNSGVFASEAQFDWDIIKCLLKQPEFDEDPQAPRFLEKLIAFYMPSNRQFSAIETEREQARSMCAALLVLADFILERTPNSHLLSDLVNDICTCLKQIQGENIPLNSVLSPAKASSTLGQAYFLLIGRLTGSDPGLRILERADIFGQLQKLLTANPTNMASISYNDVYIKLALSPLDYTRAGPTRTLFSHVITLNPSESARIYCVNLLRMLVRCRLSDLSRWIIEILVTCLSDDSPAMRATAYEVLNEACDVTENLDSLIALNPQLNATNEDNAWMLLLRYFSREQGLAQLRRKGILDSEIERWGSVGRLKYVKWVEYTINQSVSRHRRCPDGKYGRREGNEHKLHRLRAAFCPPHLLGQLAAHEAGIVIIKEKNIVQPLCETIRNGHMDTPTCVFYVKAALWSVGHLCKTPAGLRLVQEQDILRNVVDLAKTANVLSVRGTAFFCLCLSSVTAEGCDLLSEMGWQGVRQPSTTSEAYPSRRTESCSSQGSLESSWPSISEFRERAGSIRDSISFDDISLTASEDPPNTPTVSNPPSNWSFTDMRKMVHCYTSQIDATGYGTLKMLRPKRRYRSTGEPIPVPRIGGEDLPSKDDTMSYTTSIFVGLVLPRHISSIFNRDFLAAEHTLASSSSYDLPRESFGTVHKRETCLRCGELTGQECDEFADVAKPSVENAIRDVGSDVGKEGKDPSGSPFRITAQDRQLARNDLLRYVINLAAVYPNSNKAIEQLLLSMKQKQPWVFNDLCLFSDCCHLMRIFQLKQPFRKFLQELFMDVNFGEFKARAEAIVKRRTSMPVNPTTETIREDDEQPREQLADELQQDGSSVQTKLDESTTAVLNGTARRRVLFSIRDEEQTTVTNGGLTPEGSVQDKVCEKTVQQPTPPTSPLTDSSSTPDRLQEKASSSAGPTTPEGDVGGHVTATRVVTNDSTDHDTLVDVLKIKEQEEQQKQQQQSDAPCVSPSLELRSHETTVSQANNNNINSTSAAASEERDQNGGVKSFAGSRRRRRRRKSSLQNYNQPD